MDLSPPPLWVWVFPTLPWSDVRSSCYLLGSVERHVQAVSLIESGAGCDEDAITSERTASGDDDLCFWS